MPLLQKLDETKLRSLKYGDDTPYVVTDIVTGEIQTKKIPLVGKALSLIPRNVSILGKTIDLKNSRAESAIIDTTRIASFLADPKVGPQFIASQVGLQLMNVKPNFGNTQPISSTGIVGQLLNNFAPTPTQQYSPLNSLIQVAANGVGLHVSRHGFTPLSPLEDRYEEFVKDTSGLLTLFNSKINISENKPKSKILQLVSKAASFLTTGKSDIFNKDGQALYQYAGGPDSLMGIGSTRIIRYYNTQEEQIKYKENVNFEKYNESSITYTSTLGASIQYFKSIKDAPSTDSISQILLGHDDDESKKTIPPTHTTQKTGVFDGTIKNPRVPFNLFRQTSGSFDYNKVGPENGIALYNEGVLDKDRNLTYTNYLGDTVKIKPAKSFTNLTREIRIGSGRKDAINLTPLFYGNTVDNNSNILIKGKRYNIRDLIKFRIEAIDNDNANNSVFMVFRSYITKFDESYTGEWNGFRYVGRGETFRNYGGFDRGVNVGFRVAALSSDEMQPMYSKMNYLASCMMPDYNNGYMRGTYFKLTVGNWLYRQTGIITSLNYSVVNDAPWEIAIDEPEGGATSMYELPHIVDVSFSFIPIGIQDNTDNLMPQKQKIIKGKNGDEVSNIPIITQRDDNQWVNSTIVGEGTSDGDFNSNYEGVDNIGLTKK
jgi:hypothetical protein